MLPELIHIDATNTGSDWQWFPALLALMATETRSARLGGEAVVTRLCDILVIQAIRSWIDTDPAAKTGWLGALGDPAIGRAIALIHRAPERPWSVKSLAAEVAMSRSSFSARFSELVGQPAMHYVTTWRMYVAIDLMRDEGLSISETARRLGYESEASFSRAFKRVLGYPPSTARRAKR
jgi:transcriptional regulator GlxA family with amidase domain